MGPERYARRTIKEEPSPTDDRGYQNRPSGPDVGDLILPLLGAHMSIAGGYYKAVEEARRWGCDVVQLFTKNNAQWRAKSITEEEAGRFRAALVELSISHPISHASYLINLGSPDEALREK